MFWFVIFLKCWEQMFVVLLATDRGCNPLWNDFLFLFIMCLRRAGQEMNLRLSCWNDWVLSSPILSFWPSSCGSCLQTSLRITPIGSLISIILFYLLL